MTLSLDGARERIVGPNQAVVQCVSAVWTYRYRNGYTVALRGPFQAYVVVTPNATPSGASARSVPPTAFKFMIDHIQFDSNRYEKHVAVEVIGDTRLDANKTPQVGNVSTPSPTMNSAIMLPAPPPQPPQPPRQASQRDDEKWEEPRIAFERVSIPAEPVNAFGIPQATMRCLEVRLPVLNFRLPERLSTPIPNPTRPQSQQQARQSFTPRIPSGLLPMNPTMLPPNSTLLPPNPMLLPPNPTLLLQGRPAITGASISPPQPRPIMGSVVTGPPLTSTPLTDNGDLSRQPGVPGIRASLPRSVCSQWPCRIYISHRVVAL